MGDSNERSAAEHAALTDVIAALERHLPNLPAISRWKGCFERCLAELHQEVSENYADQLEPTEPPDVGSPYTATPGAAKEHNDFLEYRAEPSDGLIKRAVSEAYSLGYRLRTSEVPVGRQNLVMAVSGCRDLLSMLEALYEQQLGEPARGRAWRDLMDRSFFEIQARKEIEQLTGEGGK